MKSSPTVSLLLLAYLLVPVRTWGADELVSTAIYARIGNGYQRERLDGGGYKPEYYALSNGGRIAGTTSDITVDRVSYAEVAGIAVRLLDKQSYYYAQTKDQAKLLIVLQWGNTIAPNQTNYAQSVNSVGTALSSIAAINGPQGAGSIGNGMTSGGVVGGGSAASGPASSDNLDGAMIRLASENRARDQINEFNSKVLGYIDDINESNDIRRWAGGGDRYNDLIADVEETRYYIAISAYDFPELEKTGKKKLLWQTRVSVGSPGNRFDDSVAAMLKSASKFFGQDSGRLIRGEETKATVEMGDIKFLGEARENEAAPAKAKTPAKEGK